MIVIGVVIGSLLAGFLLYNLLTAMFPTIMKEDWLHKPTFTVRDVREVCYMRIDNPFEYQPDSYINFYIKEFCNEQGFKSAVEIYGNTSIGFYLWYQERTCNEGILQQAQKAKSNYDMRTSVIKTFPGQAPITKEELKKIHYSKFITPDDEEKERTE